MRSILLTFLVMLSSCSSPNTPKTSATITTTTTPKASTSNNSNVNAGTNLQPAPIVAPQPPIISISGFKKGDEYSVDGPLWYDGTAKLEEFNSSELRINIVMNAPNVGIPYQLKDGKINVTIKFFKDSKYNLHLYDNNKDKAYMVPQVGLEIGKLTGGWFSKDKEYAKITASTQYYTFTIESPQVITISSNTMPGGLTLTKR